MKREIIKIDKEKCNGCGVCVPNCHEGALQIIDGKATLVSELMCDGLGACIGHCPEGAITIEEREAESYDEIIVLKRIIPEGKNVLIAHLRHLKEHEQYIYLKPAVMFLKENAGSLDFSVEEVIGKVHNSEPLVQDKKGKVKIEEMTHNHQGGCPGSLSRSMKTVEEQDVLKEQKSHLTNWPVQMHLVNPNAPYFRDAELLLCADCVAYAAGSFHQKYLKGKTLVIACPKLDANKEEYIDKLKVMIDNAGIKSITVLKMEVPCCSGLVQLVKIAMSKASREVSVRVMTIGIEGQEKVD